MVQIKSVRLTASNLTLFFAANIAVSYSEYLPSPIQLVESPIHGEKEPIKRVESPIHSNKSPIKRVKSPLQRNTANK